MDTDVKEKYEALSWRVLSSVRYHGRRESFFMTYHRIIMFFVAVSGLCVMVSGVMEQPPLVLVPFLGAAVMLLCVLDMLMEFSTRAALHGELKRRFAHVNAQMADISEDDADEIDSLIREVWKIESGQPRVLNVLNNICYNEVAADEGRLDAMVPISFMQRLCASFFDWRPGALILGAATGGSRERAIWLHNHVHW